MFEIAGPLPGRTRRAMTALHLVSQLRPALIVHITGLLLGKCRHRQYQIRLRGGAVRQQIQRRGLFRRGQRLVHQGMGRAAVKIILQHDEVGCLAGLQLAQSFTEAVLRPRHQMQPQAVDFGRQQTQINSGRRRAIAAAFVQGPGDIRGGPDQVGIAAATARNYQRPARGEQLSGDSRQRFLVARGDGGIGVNLMGERESVADQARRRVDQALRGDIVQSGGAAGENNQRAALLLGQYAHRGILPARDSAGIPPVPAPGCAPTGAAPGRFAPRYW